MSAGNGGDPYPVQLPLQLDYRAEPNQAGRVVTGGPGGAAEPDPAPACYVAPQPDRQIEDYDLPSGQGFNQLAANAEITAQGWSPDGLDGEQ